VPPLSTHHALLLSLTSSSSSCYGIRFRFRDGIFKRAIFIFLLFEHYRPLWALFCARCGSFAVLPPPHTPYQVAAPSPPFPSLVLLCPLSRVTNGLVRHWLSRGLFMVARTSKNLIGAHERWEIIHSALK
jgi:hypothetical protein